MLFPSEVQMPETIQKGDVVRLKSDGPDMTVTEINYYEGKKAAMYVCLIKSNNVLVLDKIKQCSGRFDLDVPRKPAKVQTIGTIV